MTKIMIFNREGKQEIISPMKHKQAYFTNVWNELIDTWLLLCHSFISLKKNTKHKISADAVFLRHDY